MGNKKRSRNITVYCAIEGKDELRFLEFLKEQYSDPKKMKFPENPYKGGNSDVVLQNALKNTHKFDRALAWFDEDIDILDKENLKSLAKYWNLDSMSTQQILTEPINSFLKSFNQEKKNPTLIISQPVCFEGFILRILGKKCPHTLFDENIRDKQVKDLKNAIPEDLKKDPYNFYKKYLTKDCLEKKRNSIAELDLLIKIISPKK